MMLRIRLFVTGLVTVVVLVVLINFIRSQAHLHDMFEESLASEAKHTTNLFVSMREFIAKSQDKINYDSKGNFEFKHLNPAAVGRGVGEILGRKGGVRIKQTRLYPRIPANAPDEFEKAALMRFEKNRSLMEITGRTGPEGEKTFRYMRPLAISMECLRCHGLPEGEVDIAGYPREGYEEGDLGGAFSVSIPVSYRAGEMHNVLLSNVLFFLLLGTVAVVVSLILGSHIDKLYKDLAAHEKRIEELSELKDDLTHMIVHDLKNPLTPAMSSLSLVLDTKGDELSAQSRDLIEMARRNQERLLKMIQTILDISRLEQAEAHLNRELVVPADFFKGIFDELHDDYPERNLQYHAAEDLPMISLDKELIERVVENLLKNAHKHTAPQEGSIELRLSRSPSGNLIVSVTDNGEGIPENQTGNLFRKFSRVETAAHKAKADTGLGLAFCKLAVEAHGGRIWVESEQGKGSTFTFELPAKQHP